MTPGGLDVRHGVEGPRQESASSGWTSVARDVDEGTRSFDGGDSVDPVAGTSSYVGHTGKPSLVEMCSVPTTRARARSQRRRVGRTVASAPLQWPPGCRLRGSGCSSSFREAAVRGGRRWRLSPDQRANRLCEASVEPKTTVTGGTSLGITATALRSPRESTPSKQRNLSSAHSRPDRVQPGELCGHGPSGHRLACHRRHRARPHRRTSTLPNTSNPAARGFQQTAGPETLVSVEGEYAIGSQIQGEQSQRRSAAGMACFVTFMAPGTEYQECRDRGTGADAVTNLNPHGSTGQENPSLPDDRICGYVLGTSIQGIAGKDLAVQRLFIASANAFPILLVPRSVPETVAATSPRLLPAAGTALGIVTVAIEEIASSLLQVRARNSWSSGAASSRISSKISFGRAANADGWSSGDGVSRSCGFGQRGSLNEVPNDNPYVPWDTKHSPLFGGMILPTDLNVNLPLRIHGQSGAASCSSRVEGQRDDLQLTGAGQEGATPPPCLTNSAPSERQAMGPGTSSPMRLNRGMSSTLKSLSTRSQSPSSTRPVVIVRTNESLGALTHEREPCDEIQR
ncbi:hypothetical protein Purlil1_12860 [Purpureocillium lilacinum]|uniref:Uncharacterized protein n=1 Tax=Purpureocillium lilacinum TaxID=33203 RepID=A0ABR0BFN6_PURLI|nr:hypothetical protein Purlil1_12860 [Purpureocillium lilacinum]